LDSARKLIDPTRFVSDSAGGNLCERAFNRFAELYDVVPRQVYPGTATIEDTFFDQHDAYALNGKIHFDQWYLDHLVRKDGDSGSGTYWTLARLAVHEVMHELRRPVTNAAYDHPEKQSEGTYDWPFSEAGKCLNPPEQ
jgi:hypothetical protein